MSRPGRSRADARALVARLNQEAAPLQGRKLLAPVLPGGRIRTRLAGLIDEFTPRGAVAGWGRFRPVNEREATFVREAFSWERATYLEHFPSRRDPGTRWNGRHVGGGLE